MKSAVLTKQADWGLVWVVEFEVAQPHFHSYGQAPTGIFDRDFIDKNGGIQMNASQLMHALESLITPWVLQVCVNMGGRTNTAYVAQYKPGAETPLPPTHRSTAIGKDHTSRAHLVCCTGSEGAGSSEFDGPGTLLKSRVCGLILGRYPGFRPRAQPRADLFDPFRVLEFGKPPALRY